MKSRICQVIKKHVWILRLFSLHHRLWFLRPKHPKSIPRIAFIRSGLTFVRWHGKITLWNPNQKEHVMYLYRKNSNEDKNHKICKYKQEKLIAHDCTNNYLQPQYQTHKHHTWSCDFGTNDCHWLPTKWLVAQWPTPRPTICHKLMTLNTLPETNMTPENRPSPKENNLPTIHFQGLC